MTRIAAHSSVVSAATVAAASTWASSWDCLSLEASIPSWKPRGGVLCNRFRFVLGLSGFIIGTLPKSFSLPLVGGPVAELVTPRNIKHACA